MQNIQLQKELPIAESRLLQIENISQNNIKKQVTTRLATKIGGEMLNSKTVVFHFKITLSIRGAIIYKKILRHSARKKVVKLWGNSTSLPPSV